MLTLIEESTKSSTSIVDIGSEFGNRIDPRHGHYKSTVLQRLAWLNTLGVGMRDGYELSQPEEDAVRMNKC